MSNARELAELGGSYGTGGFVGMKNRIINGAMVIDQRNAGAAVNNGTATTLFTLDRWSCFGFISNKFSVQQSTDAPTGFTNSLKVTSSSAYSVPSGETYTFGQNIEGYNFYDLGFGAAGAGTVTISFWVKSSLTGSFGASVTNNTIDRSYTFAYTINAANTWEYKTVTIAGDTAGTWNKTNSTGVTVRFGLGSGAGFSTAANTWTAGNYVQPPSTVSVVGTNAATFYITGVQLEKGSTATSFDYRPYGTELALCQRYFCSSYNTGVAPGNGAQNIRSGVATVYNSNESDSNVYYFPVTMRAGPTMTYYRPSFISTNGNWGIYGPTNGWSTGYTPATQVANTRYLIVSFGSLSGATNNNSYIISGDWTASSEL